MSAQVFAADEQSDRPVDLARWVALAERVLADRGIGDDAELSLMFVDETAIAGLNERFLGRKGSTDVLSFPIEDELIGPGHVPDQEASGPGRGPAEVEDMPLAHRRRRHLPRGSLAPGTASTLVPTRTSSPCCSCTGSCTCSAWTTRRTQRRRVMEALEQQLLAAHHREPGTSP